MSKLNTKSITRHLRTLAAEVNTEHFGSDGGILTNEEAAARLLWKKALGYTETIRNEEGNQKEVKHKPEAWALQYVMERLEGKIAHAQSEDTNRVRAADKVRELSKTRLNQLATAVAGPKGPPKHKPKAK